MTWVPAHYSGGEGGYEIPGYWGDANGNPVQPGQISTPSIPTVPFKPNAPTPAMQGLFKPSAPMQASFARQLVDPVSGYANAPNYGAELARWQFSNTAPVPSTAPRGWGRSPGTGGAPPQAPWVSNPFTPGPQNTPGFNPRFTPTTPGAGGTPPPTAPPTAPTGPQWTTGGNATITNPNWPNGLKPTDLPQLTTGAVIPSQWSFPAATPGAGGGGPMSESNATSVKFGPANGMANGVNYGPMAGGAAPAANGSVPAFLSGFRFANAPAGSEAAKVNSIFAKYGVNDGMNYLMSNAWGDLGGQFRQQAARAGLSAADVNTVINNWGAGGGNYYPELGGFNGGRYSWGLGSKSKLPKLVY
jgi:hypothetical protein